jgi:hypothetical protein
MPNFEKLIECPACRGAGVYVGMAERGGAQHWSVISVKGQVLTSSRSNTKSSPAVKRGQG